MKPSIQIKKSFEPLSFVFDLTFACLPVGGDFGI
jgi:hypothetical protein